MDTYFKIIAAVLVAVILGMVLNRESKETAVLLSLCVCVLVIGAAVSFLKPVLEFWEQLKDLGQLHNTWLTVLMKVVGIGLIAEIASLICRDAGNSSLGKTIEILSSCVILWLSIPLLQELIKLIQSILGEV